MLTADVALAVGELDTVLHVNAWSINQPPSHVSVCQSGSERIVRYRWDLDGDGRFERQTQRASQRVQLDEPGVHVVRVEVQDAEGDKAEAELSLEVLGDDEPSTLLDTVDFELVPTLASDLSGCITELCIEARTRLAELEIDSVRVVESRSSRVLLEREKVALTPDLQTVACAKFAAGMTPSIPVQVILGLEGETRTAREDWGGSLGCE